MNSQLEPPPVQLPRPPIPPLEPHTRSVPSAARNATTTRCRAGLTEKSFTRRT
jgi:hypothetical protein